MVDAGMLLDQRIAAQRVLFGPRGEALAALRLDGALMIVGSARSIALLDGISLAAASVHRFPAAEPHNPQSVVDAMRAHADALAPQAVVAIGSSSAIDLGKAVRFERDTQLVCIPTALGGAEMTRGFGVVQPDGVKAGDGLSVPSDVVIYDAALLASLPPRELGSIGINAWAHTIEAAYARNGRLLGLAAAERAGAALPDLLLTANGERTAAVHAALFEAAFLAGFALNACGMGLHHAACHVLGGWTRLPHGIVNAIVLPHAVAVNRVVAPEAVARVERAFGVTDLAETARRIARAYGLPATLQEAGADPGVLTVAPQRIAVARILANNPAPVPIEAIEALVRAAYGG